MNRNTRNEHALRAIHRAIRSCFGVAAALSAREICRRIGWNENLDREVRELISNRPRNAWKGVLVAKPGRGFFFAQTIEEIAEYRRLLARLHATSGSKLEDLDAEVARAGFSLEGIER